MFKKNLLVLLTIIGLTQNSFAAVRAQEVNEIRDLRAEFELGQINEQLGFLYDYRLLSTFMDTPTDISYQPVLSSENERLVEKGIQLVQRILFNAETKDIQLAAYAYQKLQEQMEGAAGLMGVSGTDVILAIMSTLKNSYDLPSPETMESTAEFMIEKLELRKAQLEGELPVVH